MSCSRMREALQAYLDGELEPGPAGRLEEHLRACGACRERLRAERVVRRFVAEAVSEAAPAALREVLEARVRGSDAGGAAIAPAGELGELEFTVENVAESPPSGAGSTQRGRDGVAGAPWIRRRGIRTALALAASIAVFLLLWALFPRTTVEAAWAPGLADDHVLHHGPTVEAGLFRSREPRELSRWFARKIGHEVVLPRNIPGATLLGGQICIVNGQRVAHAVYELDGARVSYFLLPGVAGPDARVEGRVGEVTYLAWDSPRGGVFVLGNASPGWLGRLVPR